MTVKIKAEQLRDWGIAYGDYLVIAGPCSAESEEQVHATVAGLAKLPVNVVRAGLWKPRTRPGCFEGVGEPGLRWLKEAGAAHGLPVTTEVATPEHVEAALKAGIDVLWIGARTTVNPFSVQPIADALKGVDVPVMVKNPINPDLELWLGALERLNNSGVTKLAAIHRGFTAYKKSRFRNKPNWKIPIELRHRVPNLPIICDPSHISGNRKLIAEVAQTALDLTFDGLMIESHIDPDVALSDAKQQLKPADLGKLLASLNPMRATPSDDELAYIQGLRRIIDQLDGTLISLLKQRMDIASEIGRFKKKTRLTVFQPKRWKETLQTRIRHGRELGLDENFLTRIYEYIHEESIRHQEEGPKD
ncbi:DAHP synthetase I/KDSA [Desulfovibrio sp. X2]|uniref:bifunctional 3-deoxy-7-phosphoheptulonate synthase/chorismate mutase type II n=1 Tax=Desulfovibrio sp. X2 TaxID=941449 RepID=UPI000358CB96|nr:bifunctional 3-deoxy-7-phosphoheptulonate synthase/chorismate mutase type II [Desulfovibrio sp. X2]EPR43388.1 DAHP synthetase I/KDSA [Desulfovibrio sp. X2]